MDQLSLMANEAEAYAYGTKNATEEQVKVKKEAAPKRATSVEEKAAPATVKKEAAPKKAAPVEEKAVPATAKKEATPKKAAPVEEKAAPAAEAPAPVEVMTHQPRRSVAFIGSECYPFVKTGGYELAVTKPTSPVSFALRNDAEDKERCV